ncbi:MAG: hypothetical protein HY744_09985 [Deltaproteobacteria bacterium]|nr:hypothetical protein [Deltaproteobacteria bacterium]
MRGADVAACAEDEAAVASGGLGEPTIPEASCAECKCSLPLESCQVTLVMSFGNGLCGASAYTVEATVAAPHAECASLALKNFLGMEVTKAEESTSGYCTPSGGELSSSLPQIAFEKLARVCQAPAGGGCAVGQRCMRRSNEPFDGPCIFRAGDEACPEQDYTDRVLLRSVVEDARGCKPCGCEPPEEMACKTGWVTRYADPGCVNKLEEKPIDFDDGCVTGQTSFGSLGVSVLDAGGCIPKGGEPEARLDSTTVCCVP